jgi:serine phosphatase RsbU (regulator of sigma subunit)/anti-sigma regulatory factor (Ser/Thr protein kinase)/tetratricopeptide (TPR) repeat protein/transposase
MFKKVIKEECKVPANLNYLGEMRDFITLIGRKYGVSERTINAFKLAIDEAGTNIIRHAYRDWEGSITIRMIIREKSVTVSLIDQGHSFDLNKVRDPDLQRYVEIGKKGGLGIFIIRKVIDNVEYRKIVEGNELRLTKIRPVGIKKHFGLPDISITMKAKFSLIASGIFTFIVLCGFVWSYIHQDDTILRDEMDTGRALVKSLAHQCIDPLLKDDIPELATIVNNVYLDHAPIIIEAIVTDTLNHIKIAVQLDLLEESFIIPSNANKTFKNVYQYIIIDGRPVDNIKKVPKFKIKEAKYIYDLVEPILPKGLELSRPVGTIHLLLDKTPIDKKISVGRKRTLWMAVIVLILGYVGVFGLVYVTMSPFKKLSKWISALGHGEVQDTMEFDSSDEIGEIAHAFNEITEKFRKSQVNLAEQERLQKEMQVAQEIQHTLLPDVFPEIEGYEIASYYEAAKEVGGDYFDFVEVDKDTLGIVVADVSGKGVPGSLVMTMIRTALRTEARGNKNAADVLARVNDFVINDMKRGMFVTVFYIILDSQRRMISFASAGHNPMILYRGMTKKSYYLNPRGFPIGINLPDRSLFRKSIESDTLQLREDDVLIVYTDGITEAMNPKRERFGDERFLTAIRNYGILSVDPLVDKIKNDINNFTEEFSQSDDITLVAIREKLKAEDVIFNRRARLMKLVDQEGKSVKEACKIIGVSTSTYYKYKKRFEKMGLDGLKERIIRSEIEEKHISIEDKAKIYDIIKEHPEYGSKRIHEELNSDKYGQIKIDEKRIYDELVRCRLNTKELRMAFIDRGGRGKRMKPPGTPLLTLDGQVIMAKDIKKPQKDTIPSISQADEVIQDNETTKKAAFKLRVSQGQTDTNLEKEKDTEKKEPSVLDEFLSLAEDSDTTIQNELDLNFEKNIENFTNTDEDSFDNEQEEEKTILEAAHDLASEQDKYSEKYIQEESEFEQFKDKEVTNELIIKDNKDIELTSSNDSDSQVEDSISASIADDLLNEEMGISTDVNNYHTVSNENEDFIELMEDIGFDRRTLFSGERKEEIKPKSKTQELNRKRYLESGQNFYKQGLYAKAIEEFRKAIEVDSQYTEAFHCLGDAFFRLGQLDKAMTAYEQVRQLDPNNVNVLENLGVIFANRGDYKKAVWQWGEILKRNPGRFDIIDRIKQMQKVIRQRSVYQKKS